MWTNKVQFTGLNGSAAAWRPQQQFRPPIANWKVGWEQSTSHSCLESTRPALHSMVFWPVFVLRYAGLQLSPELTDTTFTLEVSEKKVDYVQGHQIPKGGPGWGGYSIVCFHWDDYFWKGSQVQELPKRLLSRATYIAFKVWVLASVHE